MAISTNQKPTDAAFISKQQSVKPNIIMLKRHFTKWYLAPFIFQGTN